MLLDRVTYFASVRSCCMHADRLTPLGKRPTIASLSLGATRTFRLKRADPTETAKDAASGSAEAKGLPH